MNASDLTTFADEVVNQVWTTFRDTRAWPLKKPIMLSLRARGVAFDDVLRASSGRLFIYRNGSEERVEATFVAIGALDEVRELMEPLADLMREAAQRFVLHHEWAGKPEKNALRITFADLRLFWSSEPQALLASRTLKEARGAPLTWGGATGPRDEDVYFRPSIRSLRFEHVQSLEEVLQLPSHTQRADVGKFPTGPHLALLRKIWGSAEAESRWPTPLTFAIENRKLGFIPQLVEDLSPLFVRGGFREGEYDTLSLTPHAVEFIDADGSGRRALVATARACAELWAQSESSQVPLDAVATRSGLTVAALSAWALILEWEPWGHLARESGNPTGFFINDEACLKNERVQSWADYMTTWHAESEPAWLAPTPNVDAAILPQASTVPPLAFLVSADLRRVVEADLRELELLRQAGAAKALFILAGSLVEGVLVDVLGRREDLAQSILKKNGKWPNDAGLAGLIEGAARFGLVQPSVKSLLEVLKDYRDLVHPARMATTKLRARQDTAELVLQAVRVVLADLEEARTQGRLTAYETGAGAP